MPWVWVGDAPGMGGRCPGYGWKVPWVCMDDALGMDRRCPGMDGRRSKLLQKRSTNLVHWALDAAGRQQKETVAKLLLAPWALFIL